MGKAAMPAQIQLLCMVGCGMPGTGCGGGHCPLTAPACGQGNACSASAAASLCVAYGSAVQPGKVAMWSHQKGVKLSRATEPVCLAFLLGYGISVGRTAWALFVSLISFHC